MQYFSSFIQVNEQSQSKSATGTTCQNPETKWAMILYLSLRKISPIHLRCLCLGNLWKNVCCSITQTMEILDKENDCVARNAPYTPLKSLNMYIFSYGYITHYSSRKVYCTEPFPLTPEPARVPVEWCRNPRTSMSAGHQADTPAKTQKHKSQFQPRQGQALQLSQACYTGPRRHHTPRQTASPRARSWQPAILPRFFPAVPNLKKTCYDPGV